MNSSNLLSLISTTNSLIALAIALTVAVTTTARIIAAVIVIAIFIFPAVAIGFILVIVLVIVVIFLGKIHQQDGNLDLGQEFEDAIVLIKVHVIGSQTRIQTRSPASASSRRGAFAVAVLRAFAF